MTEKEQMRTTKEMEIRLKEKKHIWKITGNGRTLFKSRRWKMKGAVTMLEWLLDKRRTRKEVEMMLNDKRHILASNTKDRRLFRSYKWKLNGAIKTLKWVLKET